MEGLKFTELNYNRHGIGVTTAYFDQYVNGLRVYQATMYYYFKGQKYIGTSGVRITNISIDNVPKLSKEDAQRIAENQLPIILKTEILYGIMNLTSIDRYEVNLTYYFNYYGDKKIKMYSLVYLIKPIGIRYPDPLVIDANTGEILDNGIHPIL